MQRKANFWNNENDWLCNERIKLNIKISTVTPSVRINILSLKQTPNSSQHNSNCGNVKKKRKRKTKSL